MATKMANALVIDGEMRDSVTDGVSTVTGVDLVGVESAVRRSKKKHGGLWVGGRATLTATSLLFAPNRVNRAVTTGSMDIAITLRDVQDVWVESAFVTNIVVIRTSSSTVKLRCGGAQSFATLIERQVADARDDPA